MTIITIIIDTNCCKAIAVMPLDYWFICLYLLVMCV